MTESRARIGRIGERIAARYLEAQGLEIVARNWRCARGDVRGELDIVADDGGELVVCEVKTRRRAEPDDVLVAVDPRKAAQLRRLAGAWLAESDRTWAGVRIDAVAVSWPAGGGHAHVTHVRGAA